MGSASRAQKHDTLLVQNVEIAPFVGDLVDGVCYDGYDSIAMSEKAARRNPGQKRERKTMDEIKIGRYRHFKGNEYEVLYLAKHSETLEPMVVYRALYGEHGVWVCPASMWNETVERDGKTYRRFTYIGD